MSLFVVYLFCGVVVLILLMAAMIVSYMEVRDEEKMSSFECGFISLEGARGTFSLQFFLVAVVFLVFDVEIALILPFPIILGAAEGWLMLLVFGGFIFVVFGGLYYEWGSGVLDWGY